MTTSATGARRLVTGVLCALALTVPAAVGAALGLLALGAAVPGLAVVGDLAPLVVPVHGPGLVVVAALSALVAWILRRRMRRSATAVAIGCGVSTAALATVVGIVVAAVTQAGGSVDLAGALVASPSQAAAPPDERVVYTTAGDGQPLHLAVWRPMLAPASSPRPAPVFVYVHGGGWIGGSEAARGADLARIADAGWLVVSVEYTLARPDRPTWDVAGPQVACALATLGADAGRYGGDPARLVLAGDSAGGQLAISVGYHAASRSQVSSCGGDVPVPRAIATDYPAADLVDGYRHGATGGPPALDARYLAVTYTGGTPDQVPERYRAVSGVDAITPVAPPTLVIAPSRDALVPHDGLERFVGAARAAGVDAELVTVPVANHAFDQLRDGSLGQQAGQSVLERWSARHVGT